MSLFQKCLAFLGIVLIIQITLFGGIWWFLSTRESELAAARSSREISAHVQLGGGLLFDMLNSLTVWGVSRNAEVAKQLKDDISFAPGVLHESFSKLGPMSHKDQEQVRELDLKLGMCIESLKQVYETAGELSGMQQVANFHDIFRYEVEPQVLEIRNLSNEIRQRHDALSKSSVAKEAELTDSVRLFFITLFGVNISIIIVAVIGFSKGIAQRLAVISDNISRFWRGQALNPPIKGVDDISNLDSSFHEMSIALNEARDKETTILRNMPVGLIACSENGLIESVNPRLEEMLLIPADFIVGKSIADFVKNVDFTFDAVANSELPKVWRIGTSIKQIPAELSISRIRQKGDTKFLLGVVDVTAREQIEQLKQEFISVVSHDLRTPLTSIQIGAELVSKELYGKLSDRAHRAINNISVDCDRLLRLTRDLLDIAKLESGNISLDCGPSDLNAIFEKALNAVEPTATQKGIQLDCKCGQIPVVCDEDRMVQVLINLLSNAIKFSDKGKTVSLVATEDGEGLRIEVRDQGRGIDADRQNEIFERFKQARPEDGSQGTGLGLAICKMLIEAHSGKIGVESEVGVGSTFWITIPKTHLPGESAM